MNLVRLLIYVPNLKSDDLEVKQDLEEKDRKEHPAALLSVQTAILELCHTCIENIPQSQNKHVSHS
jgi:hypothetical protein